MTEVPQPAAQPEDTRIARLREAVTVLMGAIGGEWFDFSLAEGPPNIADTLKRKLREYEARLTAAMDDLEHSATRVTDSVAKMATIDILTDPERDGLYDREAVLDRMLSETYSADLLAALRISKDSGDGLVTTAGIRVAERILIANGVIKDYVLTGGANLSGTGTGLQGGEQ